MTKPTVDKGSRDVMEDATVTLDAPTQSWTATSAAEGVAKVTVASGAASVSPVVKGVSGGSAKVTVATDAADYLYTINVTALKRLTVNAPSLMNARHLSVKSVSTNGVALAVKGDVYKLLPNAMAAVTFEPAFGYKIVGADTLTMRMDDDKTIDANTSGLPTAQEGSVLPYEVEYRYGDLTTIIGYDGATVTTNGPNDDLIFTFSDPSKAGALQLMSPQLYSVEILAVGGGGAGGTQSRQANGAGGGGGGGYQDVVNTSFVSGIYYVHVGAGGRKADSRISSVNGNSGGNSSVTNAAGIIIASAVGGGGGGASKDDGTGGESGGSGGGGAWARGVATHGGSGAGGTGRDGQGHDGGTPERMCYGGGGGGAGARGGSEGFCLGGVGLTNSISGTPVEYARGGDGGRDDTIAPATDGAAPGWGGSGGNGGIGGSGADGVVIVRVSKMYKNIQIQKPSVLISGLNTEGPRTLKEDGSEPISEFVYKSGDAEKWCVSPNFDDYVYDINTNRILKAGSTSEYLTYHDVTNYMQGVWTTNAWTEKVTSTSNVVHGIGHYQFTVHLKEGYTWADTSDPEYGSSAGALVEWRITESLETIDATISVEKVVDWSADGSNATITVSAYATPKQNPITPNVLFLGSLCSAHSLTKQTVVNSINAIAGQANIDYYIYAYTSSWVLELRHSDSLKKGDKCKDTFDDITTGQHSVMDAFYSKLDEILQSATLKDHYDYIVFEFDGNRVAYDRAKNVTDSVEAAVSSYLLPYYQQQRVILITDDGPEGCGYYTVSGTKYDVFPWTPSRVLIWNGATDDKVGSMGDADYKALVGMFDPESYTNWTSSTVCRMYPKQIGYSNSTKVEDYLKAHIVPVAYDLTYTDKVKMNVGLSLTSVEYFVTTNNINVAEPEVFPEGWWRVANWDAQTGEIDWRPMTEWIDELPDEFGDISVSVTRVDAANNQVMLGMTDMLCETKGKIVIHIVDDGTFKTTADAVYNPVTGEWEKDPNDGKARVIMSVNGQETEVVGSAATSAAWSFKTYWITAEATHGEVFLNGMFTNKMGFAENYSPEVAYRGEPGYAINRLWIDNVDTALNATNKVRTVFYKIGSDHKVRVAYTNYVKSITATPTTNTYDGAGHVFDVRPDFIPGVDYVYEVRYSKTGQEGTYTNETDFLALNREELKNVGDHPYYYKVYALQPGWGEVLEGYGWVEISNEKLIGEGRCMNTITAKDLWITAESREIRHGDPMPTDLTVTYVGFAEGETNTTALAGTLTFACDYTAKSDIGQYPITPGGLENADPDNKNYDIHFLDGLLSVGKSGFRVDGVPQVPSLDPDNRDVYTGVPRVEKIYDGVATSIVVNVTFPTDKYTVKYSTNTNDVHSWTTELPLFTNCVEDAKVWYALESDNCFPYTNYQYVTVLPRPVTLQSATAQKVYDGTALESNKVTVVSELGFVPEEEPYVKRYTLTRRTDVGWSYNNFSVEFDEIHALSSNYAITQSPGTLTVTLARMIVGDPDDPTKQVEYPVDPDIMLRPEPGSNGVENVTNVYDGAGVRIKVNVIKPATGYTVKYSADGTTWQDDVAYTNVADSGRGIYFAIEDDRGNYTPVTNIAFVTILPKPAGLTAASDSKVYDGWALTNYDFTATGFVAGEGVAAAPMTKDSTITNAGTTNNVIDAAAVEPAEGTDLNNYAIAYTNGTLTVNRRKLTLVPTNQSAKYGTNPGEQTSITYDLTKVTGDSYVEGEEFRYEFRPGNPLTLTAPGRKRVEFDYQDNGKALVDNYDVTIAEAWLTLGTGEIEIGGSNTPNSPPEDGTNGVREVIVPYDGEGHSISVVVTYPLGEPTTISYSLDGVHWDDKVNPAFTNVTDRTTVHYAVDIDNFTSVTNYSWVTVTQRVVTVTADDQTMTFGGAEPTPLTFEVENKVATDVFTVPLELSYDTTKAGEYPDAIVTNGAITAKNAAREDVTGNYKITFVPGKLTVDPADPTVTVVPAVKEYDGTGTNITVTVDQPGLEIWYSLDGGETWTNELAITDVKLVGGQPGPYEVAYKVHDPAGNYADKTGTSTVTIQPRHVTVTVDSFSMHVDDVRAGKDKEKYSAILRYDNGEVMKAEDAAKITFEIGATGDMIVGTNTLVATGETLQGNYTMTYEPGFLVIYDKYTVEYEVSGATNVYAGVSHPLKISVAVTKPASGATVVYGLSAEGPWYPKDDPSCPSVINVSQDGGTPIYFKITVDDADYYSPVVDYAVAVVTQKLVTVTAVSETVELGQPAKLEATVDGLVDGESETLIVFSKDTDYDPATAQPDDVYDYTVTGEKSQGNYSVSYVNGTITVSGKKKVRIGGEGPFDDGSNPPPPPAEDRRDVMDSAHTGVKNVVKTYDAVGTNVTVKATDADDNTKVLDVFFLNDKGEWVTSLDFVNAGTNKVWYKVDTTGYAVVSNYAYVVIDPAPVTVTADDQTKTYGEDDPAFTTVTNGLIGADTIIHTISREPGEDVGDYAITPTGSERQGNYTVTYVDGTLTVVPAKLPDPDEPKDPDDPFMPGSGPFERPYFEDPQVPPAPTNRVDGTWSRLSNYDVVTVYDGAAHTYDAEALTNAVEALELHGNPYEIAYSLTGARYTWQAEPFRFTDVAETPTSFWYRVAVPNYTNYIHAVAVTITNRLATITFEANDKTYDGNAIATCASTNFANVVEGEGFTLKTPEMDFAFDTADVGADKKVTATKYGDALVTAVGETKKTNYAFTFVDTATADILTAPMPDPDPEDPDDPFMPGSGPFDGPYFDDPKTPPVPTNRVDGTWSKLSNYDVVTVYDGKSHTYDAEALTNAVEALDLKGNPYEIAYSLTGTNDTWQTEPFRFTDVAETPTSFWYRVEVPNYTNYIHAVAVTITQRVVRVVFPTAEKTFDGTKDLPAPLATNLSTVAENMVAGERFDALGYGLFDDPAAGDRTLTLTNVTITAANEATKFGNYKIYFGADGGILFDPDDGTEGPGPHAFGPKERDENWPDEGDPELDLPGKIRRQSGVTFEFADDADSRYYKAEAWEPPVKVYDGEGAEIADPSEYAVAYFENLHATNHVAGLSGAHAVVTMVKNYEGVVTNYFTIRRRPISFTTPGTNFVYNGSSQSLKVVDIVGLAGGEGKDRVVTNGFASVATVDEGVVPNAFAHELVGVLRAGDYVETERWGDLRVLPAPPPPPEEDDPGKDPPEPPSEDDPRAPRPPQDPLTGAIVAFSDYDTVTNYDGEAHTLDTNALWKVIDQQVAEGRWLGDKPTVQYSLDGAKGSWRDDPFAFVDVVSTGFWYRVSAPNFSNVVHAVGVTVTNRVITLRSGTTTKYLPRDGGSVTVSNGFVWVERGEFVGEDYFVATVPTSHTSAEPWGPVDNAFTAVVTPGRAENYRFVSEYGHLAIMDKPAGATEIIEEVPDKTGRDIVTIVMDNLTAGPWAADKPEELNGLALTVDKNPADKVEIRLKVSENYDEGAFSLVTNKIVKYAREEEHKEQKEIDRYCYEALDITILKKHEFYKTRGDATPTNTVVTNIGNDLVDLLTVHIPYSFGDKLIDFAVWRHHTYEGAVEPSVVKLGYGKGESDPTTGEYYTTNATEVVLHVKKLSVYVFKSLYLTTPLLEGRVRWKYHQAQNAFYAGFEAVCTNGDYSAISNLCFVFEDRDDCYLRDLKSAKHLSDTPDGRFELVEGGKVIVCGKVRMPELEQALRQAGALYATNTWGVGADTFASTRFVVPPPERKAVLAMSASLEKLAKGDISVLNNKLGYLIWQEDGYDELHVCPLTALPLDLAKAFGKAAMPLALASVNRSLALGLPAVTADSDPTLGIDGFKVGETAIEGRVFTCAGDVQGVPGPNAAITVLGAAAPQGPYAEIAAPALDAEGWFRIKKPTDAQFFRVRLTAVNVID